MPYYVYLLLDLRWTVLYTGVTRDLVRRMGGHRSKAVPGFTARYNVSDLLYFEEYSDVREALAREKQLKAASRARKEALIQSMNPTWRDLTGGL